MSWTLDSVPDQRGRIAIVTGANSGLGLETARELAGKGMTVVMACRNAGKAEAARTAIQLQYPKTTMPIQLLDLSRLASVRAFARAFAGKYDRLDLLINNAGIMMPPYGLSEDGFESQLAANYLGHFALTGLLLPLLLQTPGSRVVSLSSLAHHWSGIQFDDLQFSRGYNRRRAYGQSKLACLMFAYELQRRLTHVSAGTMSVAAHPGVSATNLFQHLPRFLHPALPLMNLVLQPARDGALPTLYAALGDDIKGGNYCGPQSMSQMRGPPVKVGSSAASHEKTAATRLWTLSEKLTGVRFPI